MEFTQFIRILIQPTLDGVAAAADSHMHNSGRNRQTRHSFMPSCQHMPASLKKAKKMLHLATNVCEIINHKFLNRQFFWVNRNILPKTEQKGYFFSHAFFIPHQKNVKTVPQHNHPLGVLSNGQGLLFHDLNNSRGSSLRMVS